MSERPTNGRPPAEPDSLLDAAGVPRGPLRTPRAYKICDGLSEGLIYLILVFSPWVFGSTQNWAIWIMNVGSYALGLLLITKWLIRWKTGYHPARWGEAAEAPHTTRPMRVVIGSLAVLTVLILAWCLVSASNARATYTPSRRAFVYFECVRWLPHSYDGTSSWFAFWQYLGLAWFFWALRDWLQGKTSTERHREREETAPSDHLYHTPILPHRLRRLLWVLCLNGALLSLVGILNRLSMTDKVLWLIKPRFGAPGFHFGPYPYRGNASQYLNLLWPVCLAFWWGLRREAMSRRFRPGRSGSEPHSFLLPCTALMAAGPVMSGSRGGLLAACLLAGSSIAVLFLTTSKRHLGSRLAIAGLVATGLGLGIWLGWDRVVARLSTATIVKPVEYAVTDRAFALRVVFRPEMPRTNVHQTLLGLSAFNSGASWRPEALNIVLAANGNLHTTIYDDSGKKQSIAVIGDFMKRFGTGVVDFVFVKAPQPRAYVNSAPVVMGYWPKGTEPLWGGSVGSSHLYIGGAHRQDPRRVSPILGAALYNCAPSLDSEGKVQLAPLATTTANGKSLHAADFTAGTDEFVARSPGLIITNNAREVVGTTLIIQRAEGTGSWVLERPALPPAGDAAPSIRAAFHVTNPGDAPCRVQIKSPAQESAAFELPARTNRWCEAVFMTRPGASLGNWTLAVIDAAGAARSDLPEGFALRLDAFSLDVPGAVAAFDFSDDPMTTRLNVDPSGRLEIYAGARQMAEDFPWLGTGPGTFGELSQLYREETNVGWAAYVHDDWLETRITFGWIGFGLILLALLLALTRSLGPGLPARGELRLVFLLAMGTCLLHAKFDFPFQIHSILLLFLAQTAIVSCLGRRKA